MVLQPTGDRQARVRGGKGAKCRRQGCRTGLTPYFGHAHGLAGDVTEGPGTNRAAIRGALGFNRPTAEGQQLWRIINVVRGVSTLSTLERQDLLPRVAQSANQLLVVGSARAVTL